MQEIERFICEDDRRVRYEVIERARIISHTLLATGQRETALGASDYTLRGGEHLNPLDDESLAFEIVKTGTVIRRVST